MISIGDNGYTRYGVEYIAKEIMPNRKIIIEFQDEHKHITDVYETNFKSGNVWNPYQITIHGHGYIGDGIYLTRKNKKQTHEYSSWNHIVERCYCKKHNERNPTYIGCTMDETWHNFQVFSEWWNQNIYYVNNERMHVDKDILIKGNKRYCPETCLIVPQRINMLFQGKRYGRELPTGVYINKNGYVALYNRKKLGNFNSVEEAEHAHELAKRKSVHEVAEEYKKYIPKKVYDALMNY